MMVALFIVNTIFAIGLWCLIRILLNFELGRDWMPQFAVVSVVVQVLLALVFPSGSLVQAFINAAALIVGVGAMNLLFKPLPTKPPGA